MFTPLLHCENIAVPSEATLDCLVPRPRARQGAWDKVLGGVIEGRSAILVIRLFRRSFTLLDTRSWAGSRVSSCNARLFGVTVLFLDTGPGVSQQRVSTICGSGTALWDRTVELVHHVHECVQLLHEFCRSFAFLSSFRELWKNSKVCCLLFIHCY